MLFAKKSFGQHFLRDQTVLDKIVAAAAIEATDIVVEVGPGRGALTEHLAYLGSRLILVEADKDLLPELRSKFPLAQIIQADAAQVDYAELVASKVAEFNQGWILVGNLPYNAGNAIIRQALTCAHPPKRQVVMLQREVGEKMLAKPTDMSLLSVAVQMYADVKRVATVKPGAFVPPPKVDSIILLLTHNPKSEAPEAVIGVAKIAFAHKRKQMHRTLADAGLATSDIIKTHLVDLGLSEHARAEELSITQWISLVEKKEFRA
ncbi:MAG: 16S rRNA (adenine(1518)-N(6)/adenine(1519)-N(6))-dimethyltransferase RsmA [Patescibacteria group bacterium]